MSENKLPTTPTESLRKSAIPQETSMRITALRFLLMVLVVFIHNNYSYKSVAEVAEKGIFIDFNQSVFGEWIQLLISQGIARSAVPLFFMFAAYIQAKKADPYGPLLKKKAKSLLIPYIIWMAIYSIWHVGIKLIVLKIAPSLLLAPENNALNWTAADWFHKILYANTLNADGTISNLPEFAIQFWFIRDLIILVIVSPILQFFAKRFPTAVFALAFTLLIVPLKIFFVANQALFFYTFGLLWGTHDIPLFEKIDKIRWSEAILLFMLTFFFTYIFFEHESTAYWLMVICACIILLKFSKVIISKNRMYKAAAYLAGFSFFLFAIHMPALMGVLQKMWLHFFPMKNGFFCLFEYFGVTALDIFLGTAIGIGLKKICPPIFRLLSGGR